MKSKSLLNLINLGQEHLEGKINLLSLLIKYSLHRVLNLSLSYQFSHLYPQSCQSFHPFLVNKFNFLQYQGNLLYLHRFHMQSPIQILKQMERLYLLLCQLVSLYQHVTPSVRKTKSFHNNFRKSVWHLYRNLPLEIPFSIWSKILKIIQQFKTNWWSISQGNYHKREAHPQIQVSSLTLRRTKFVSQISWPNKGKSFWLQIWQTKKCSRESNCTYSSRR